MENNILPKGQLATIILSTMLDGDKYGLEIVKEIKRKTNGALEIKQPSLYNTLVRMQKQGFVSSYWKEGDFGGKRHYYRITDLGKKQYQKLESTFFESQKQVTEILSKEDRTEESENIENATFASDFPNDPLPQNLADEKANNFENDLLHITTHIQSVEENHKKEIKDDGVFLPPPEKKQVDFAEIIANKPDEKVEQPLKPKDDGVFIHERIPEEARPKVRKIETAHLDKYTQNTNNNFNSIPIKPITQSTNRVENLYDKSQVNKLNKEELTYPNLEKKYNNLGINFTVHNESHNKKNQEEIDKNNQYFYKKALIIFALILVETVAVFLLAKILEIPTNHNYLYILLPVLSTALPLYYMYAKNKKLNLVSEKTNTFIFDALIFVTALILIYALNMLFGMNLNNMADYYTTLIYPSVLATNVLVSGIMNLRYFKSKEMLNN